MTKMWMYKYPTNEVPDVDKVKRVAAQVGRALRTADRYKVAVTRLQRILEEQESCHLRFWAQVLMLDPRWCGATGKGGFWAHATMMVNELSVGILRERGKAFRERYGADFVVGARVRHDE